MFVLDPQISGGPNDFGRRPQAIDVHPRMDVPTTLSRLAELHDGVVTREQVIGVGLSRLGLGGVLLGGPHARLGP